MVWLLTRDQNLRGSLQAVALVQLSVWLSATSKTVLRMSKVAERKLSVISFSLAKMK